MPALPKPYRPLIFISAALAVQVGLILLTRYIGVFTSRIPDPPVEVPATAAPKAEQTPTDPNWEATKEAMDWDQTVDDYLSTEPLPDLPEIPEMNRDKFPDSPNAAVPVLQSSLSQVLPSSLQKLRMASMEDPPAVAFLGESAAARSVVLAIDISASVKTKVESAGSSMRAIRKAALDLVDQLGPNTLFTMLQFSRRWDLFEARFVPGTVRFKANAKNWLEADLKMDGSAGRNWHKGPPDGIEGVLAACHDLGTGPDLIIIVSDGDFQTTPPGGGSRDVAWEVIDRFLTERTRKDGRPPRLHWHLFQPPADDEEAARKTAEKHRGRIRIHG